MATLPQIREQVHRYLGVRPDRIEVAHRLTDCAVRAEYTVRERKVVAELTYCEDPELAPHPARRGKRPPATVILESDFVSWPPPGTMHLDAEPANDSVVEKWYHCSKCFQPFVEVVPAGHARKVKYCHDCTALIVERVAQVAKERKRA